MVMSFVVRFLAVLEHFHPCKTISYLFVFSSRPLVLATSLFLPAGRIIFVSEKFIWEMSFGEFCMCFCHDTVWMESRTKYRKMSVCI